MITVNAMGDACPIPVVKTKKAIDALGGKAEEIETLVDNETAVQNLTKLAGSNNFPVQSEKLGEGQYRVLIHVPEGAAAGAADEEAPACIPDARGGSVVVISSSTMGNGSDELGASLMKAFIYALSQQDTLPKAILFYNGGVKLTTGDSASIDDLKSMEAQGVEILSCGTCLNFFGLTDSLKVGGVTNMYDIVEKQNKAVRIIRP